MSSRAVDAGGVRWSGLVVAAIGFTISRLTVANSVTMETGLVEFVLTGAIPMVLAFGLVVFGLVLAVSSVDHRSVRTIGVWCVLGTVAMAIAAAVSILGTPSIGMMGEFLDARSSSFTANTVLGGAVGGTLIGVYAARAARRNRRISAQADRMHLLNRLLRDEVLNATTVILARADFLANEETTSDDHVRPLQRNAEHIQAIIEDIGELTDETRPEDRVFDRVAVAPLLDRCVETLETTHGHAEITVSGDTDAEVYADDQLGVLFDQLLSNSIEHSDDAMPQVDVTIGTTERTVAVTIADEGPGLGENEQALLESGDLSRYDRPSEGFGLWIVRILLDRYDGVASVDVDDGTAVTIELPRANGHSSEQTGTFSVPPGRLLMAGIAGVIAGVVMGITLQTFTNILPVIGALYGSQSAAVGWITHLFHSVVFAVAFATGLSHPQATDLRDSPAVTTGLAIVFGTLLWFVAAGIVMPIWLNAVGIAVPIPRLRFVPLIGHLLWGGVFGVLFWCIARIEDRISSPLGRVS